LVTIQASSEICDPMSYSVILTVNSVIGKAVLCFNRSKRLLGQKAVVFAHGLS